MTGPENDAPKALELFAGAGGLALGVERAGFVHLAATDNDPHACATLRRNRSWAVLEEDVRTLDWKPWAGRIDLLAGGAPCQPFSFGGKHKGRLDERDQFPQLLRTVAEIRPKAVLLENVRGLARSTFADYLAYVLQCLARPSRLPRTGETQEEHASRLRHDRVTPIEYQVHGPVVLNAADYGVPQTRQRLFMVALRVDLDIDWEWPQPTHSLNSLMAAQKDGRYWQRHGLPVALPVVPPRRDLGKLLNDEQALVRKPWRTVRDAIADLPEPAEPGTPGDRASVQFHVRIDTEARTYHGHEANLLDLPAKTVKAGIHGSPGGESIVSLDDGRKRRLTLRENARLQDFPDDYAFSGAASQAMRQIGNAVPAAMARSLAEAIRDRVVPALRSKENS